MNSKTNNYTEKLIRKKLLQKQYSFDESNWVKMDLMLEQEALDSKKTISAKHILQDSIALFFILLSWVNVDLSDTTTQLMAGKMKTEQAIDYNDLATSTLNLNKPVLGQQWNNSHKQESDKGNTSYISRKNQSSKPAIDVSGLENETLKRTISKNRSKEQKHKSNQITQLQNKVVATAKIKAKKKTNIKADGSKLETLENGFDQLMDVDEIAASAINQQEHITGTKIGGPSTITMSWKNIVSAPEVENAISQSDFDEIASNIERIGIVLLPSITEDNIALAPLTLDSTSYLNYLKNGILPSSKLTAGISLGANYFPYFDSEACNCTRINVTPRPGIFVNYQFAQRIGMQSELYYKYLRNQNIKSQQMEVPSLVPFADSTLLRAQTSSLYFVELPTFLTYKLTENTSLTAGFKLGLLLNAIGSESAQRLICNCTTYSADRGNYNYQGFRKLDTGISIGFQKKHVGGLSYGMRYNQGLADITKNEFFNNANIMTNSDFQIYFLYNLKQ